MADVASDPMELKRLSPVVAACGAAAASGPACALAALYARGKDTAVLQPLMRKVEALATPYVRTATCQDTVKSIDTKVDATIASAVALYEAKASPLVAKASSAYGSARAYGTAVLAAAPKGSEQFVQLRDEWLASMETVLTDLKAQCVSLPAATVALVQTKIEAVKGAVPTPADSRSAMESCVAAWEKLLAYPSVAKVTEKAAPAVVAAKELALKAFETVTESEQFGKYVTPVMHKCGKYMPTLIQGKLAAPAPAAVSDSAAEPAAVSDSAAEPAASPVTELDE